MPLGTILIIRRKIQQPVDSPVHETDSNAAYVVPVSVDEAFPEVYYNYNIARVPDFSAHFARKLLSPFKHINVFVQIGTPHRSSVL